VRRWRAGLTPIFASRVGALGVIVGGVRNRTSVTRQLRLESHSGLMLGADLAVDPGDPLGGDWPVGAPRRTAPGSRCSETPFRRMANTEFVEEARPIGASAATSPNAGTCAEGLSIKQSRTTHNSLPSTADPARSARNPKTHRLAHVANVTRRTDRGSNTSQARPHTPPNPRPSRCRVQGEMTLGCLRMWGQPFGALRREALGSNAFVGGDAGFDGVTAWAASSRARGPSEMTSSRSFARVGTHPSDP